MSELVLEQPDQLEDDHVVVVGEVAKVWVCHPLLFDEAEPEGELVVGVLGVAVEEQIHLQKSLNLSLVGVTPIRKENNRKTGAVGV